MRITNVESRGMETHVQNWLADYDSAETRRAYEREARSWLEWCAARELNPLAADRATMNQWKNSTEGSPATRARRLAAISSLYRYLTFEGVLECNPLAHVRRPKLDPDFTETRGLTRDEATRLLNSVRDDPMTHAAVCLLMLDGLRASETIGATVTDLRRNRGQPMLTITRKGGRRQTVPLGPVTYEAVLGAIDGRTRGPILAHPSGAGWTYSTLYHAVRRAVTRCGLDDASGISPHSLRHTFATLCLDAGAQLRDVQDALAHRDPRTTRRYDRARDVADRHPAATLEKYLGL